MESRRVLAALTILLVMVPAAPAAARPGKGSPARRPASPARRPASAARRPASPARRPASTTVVVGDAQSRLLALINRDRAAAGLGALQASAAARGVADGWSRQMAEAGALSHNHGYLNAASLQRFHAVLAGENVAVGSTLDGVHRVFMQSPQHRANILDPQFRLVGVAAVRTAAGLVYVTEDFLRPQ